ncbi:MAG: transposase [Chlorobi bacterium]|nr:transposase [Chlorobiota bacterium]
MRKNFDRLSGIVQNILMKEPASGNAIQAIFHLE